MKNYDVTVQVTAKHVYNVTAIDEDEAYAKAEFLAQKEYNVTHKNTEAIDIEEQPFPVQPEE